MKNTILDKVLTQETKAGLVWAKAPIYKRVLAFIIDLFIFHRTNLTFRFRVSLYFGSPELLLYHKSAKISAFE